MNDYSFLFRTRDLPSFLFVAKLKDSEGETGEEWEGRIKAMTKSIRGRFEDLKTEILAKIRGEVERISEAMKTKQQDLVD